YETLVQHALNGFQEPGKVMPPRGGNPDLSDVEVERAVVYMANRSGANFKEPPEMAAAAASATKAGAPLDLASGQAMMQKDGCAACHAVDKTIVGPAYNQVAAKY